MNKIINYTVVKNTNLGALIAEVNYLLKDGMRHWKLVGGIASDKDGYYQALLEDFIEM